MPTGFQSKELIVNAGLKLGDVGKLSKNCFGWCLGSVHRNTLALPDQFPVIDVTIDGADDVDWALNAIKGGGACHLREKVLAEAAEEFIIVADYRKNNMILGQVRRGTLPLIDRLTMPADARLFNSELEARYTDRNAAFRILKR